MLYYMLFEEIILFHEVNTNIQPMSSLTHLFFRWRLNGPGVGAAGFIEGTVIHVGVHSCPTHTILGHLS